MNKATILLCGDHSQTRQMLEVTLIRMGYHVTSLDGTPLPLVMMQQQPDLVFVDDLMVCHQLRENWHALPILFYSSYDSPQHVVQALDQGADDYIVVPFAREEFAARMRARLRHTASVRTTEAGLSEDATLEVLQSADGAICLNVATHRVQVNHQDVRLTRTEFHLLQCFLLHAGKTLTYDFLLTTVWGSEYEGMEEYVRVYVRRLRQKIEPDATHPTYLRTKLNQGYVFYQPEAKG